MIRGVGRVIVFAKDMQKMTAFYRDVLGMTALGGKQASADWQPFETGGDCSLALHAIPEPWRDGIEVADPAEARVGVPTKVVLRVEDAAKSLEVLTDRGVRFARGEAPSPPLVRFDILDPEGNIVQISQEP